jgi:hypothetical protein
MKSFVVPYQVGRAISRVAGYFLKSVFVVIVIVAVPSLLPTICDDDVIRGVAYVPVVSRLILSLEHSPLETKFDTA